MEECYPIISRSCIGMEECYPIVYRCCAGFKEHLRLFLGDAHDIFPIASRAEQDWTNASLSRLGVAHN
jgi:hypothetical protein